ncbi:heterokaryon incompatibility protein-domain-containing protein [Aspergillus bertholletiae]|uniref:Heterokaryon incompatibility protein-domain-containing protein n=1 Tax=Aspergillus bertholletiae TaxID=1226010 RepID=A0A5N7B5C8_9EURO|nr:heterokaryon incompatibility protein-domain-containing protein [Aspergillus bertholletiae]
MFFWVDAICINQEDIVEKNSQVLQMSSIYRCADQVLSWLGVEAYDSDYAIEMITDVSGKIAAALDKGDPLSWMVPSQTELWQANYHYKVANRFWSSAVWLLRRPYWSRAWIIQEIVLAREVTMLCGIKPIRFQDLVTISTWILGLLAATAPPFCRQQGLGLSGNAIGLGTSRMATSR